MGAPNSTRLAAQAARRATLAALVRRAGFWLLLGAIASVALAAVDRLFAAPLVELITLWGVIAIPLALTAITALALTYVHRLTPDRAAILLDERLSLEDAVSSALEFSRKPDGAFTALAVRDAENLASGVHPSRAFPLRFGAFWALWPICSGVAIAALMFVPALERQTSPVIEVSEDDRQVATEEVAQAVQAVQEAIDESAAAQDDIATPSQLQTLEQLQRELAEGTLDPQRARVEAADALQETATGLEKTAEQKERAARQTADELAQRLSESGDPETTEQARELAEALKQGDLESAREAARKLSERVNSLSPEQREQLARELERMADQIDPDPSEQVQSPPQTNQPPQEPTQSPAEPTPDQPDQQPRAAEPQPEVSELTDEAEIAERLREQGADPQAAQRRAEEIAQQNRERQAQDQARRESKDMSEALREAADQARDPQQQEQQRPPSERQQPGQQPNQQPGQQDQSAPPQPRDQSQGQQSQGQEGQQNQQPGQDEQQQPAQQTQEQGQNQQPGKQPGNQQQPAQQQPGEQPTQQPGEQPGQQPGQQPGERPDQQPGERPGDQPTQQPGERPGAEPSQEKQPGQQQGQPGQPDQQPGQQPGQSQQPGAQEDPSAQRTPRPGGGQDTGQAPTPGVDPNAPPDPTQNKRGFDRLADQLDRLSRNQGASEQARERADDLRRRAEEMLENATPEERRQMLEQLEKMRRERGMGKDGDSPFGAPPPNQAQDPRQSPAQEDIDLRDPDSNPPPDRVIGDWFSDQPQLPEDRTARRALADTVRESQQSAERAFEQQRLPRRRQDLIRRIFDRYAEQVERDPSSTGGGG